MSKDLFVSLRVVLRGRDLSWKAVRASGPGGQNVNKVASKVELRFDLANTTALDWAAKGRLRSLAAGRLDADGAVIIVSQATRSQEQNLEDARQRLAELVSRALIVPKKRRRTKPSRSSVERRLEGKRLHAHKKEGRRGGRGGYDD
jgi:ribosome-associated protein